MIPRLFLTFCLHWQVQWSIVGRQKNEDFNCFLFVAGKLELVPWIMTRARTHSTRQTATSDGSGAQTTPRRAGLVRPHRRAAVRLQPSKRHQVNRWLPPVCRYTRIEAVVYCFSELKIIIRDEKSAFLHTILHMNRKFSNIPSPSISLDFFKELTKLSIKFEF